MVCERSEWFAGPTQLKLAKRSIPSDVTFGALLRRRATITWLIELQPLHTGPLYLVSHGFCDGLVPGHCSRAASRRHA
jgi:hypothetical protein